MSVKPGLGATVETMYEWWNVALMDELYGTLTDEWRAAKARVKEEGVPWVDAMGRRRLKPTEAEKLVQKKGERRERLQLLAEKMGPLHDAEKVQLDAKGKPVRRGGTRRFHFKGKFRCVKVNYARMRKRDAEIGRRYPNNMPCVLREGDDWVGEADRLLAATAQGMPKDVRKFCLPYLHDIDLKACHPSILASKAKKYGVAVPNLDRYVANTDDCRLQVMEIHNVSRDNAKTLFTLLLYGGSYKHRLKKWGRSGVEAQPIKFVQRLETELAALRDEVMARSELQHLVTPLMAFERTRKSNFNDGLKTEEEAKRSVWSQITQMWEDEALSCIQCAVEAQGCVVHSLMFDGLMVYHDPSVDLAEAMRAASDVIREETAMELVLEEKELYDEVRVGDLV